MPTVAHRPPDEAIWTRPFTLALLATTSTFVGLFFLLPTLPPYALDLGASKAQAGWLVTLFTVPAVLARTLTGSYLDRGGRKRMLVSGLLLIALATTAYGLAPTLSLLFALRAAHGAGWGLATTAFGSLVTDLAPPHRRGEAIGYWGMAPTAAMGVGPLVGQWLQGAFGYAVLFSLSGLLALAAFAVVLFIADVPPSVPVGPRKLVSLPREARLPAATLFLSSFAYGTLVAFLPVEMAAHGGSTGGFFTIFALAILVARPVAGRLSDRWGRTVIVHPSLASAAAGTIVLGFAPSPVALAAAAVLYGIGVGSSFPALMAFTVDRTPIAMRGAALAAFFTAYDLAMAAGALLLGPVYEWLGFLVMNVAAASGIVVAQVLFVAVLVAEGRRKAMR